MFSHRHHRSKFVPLFIFLLSLSTPAIIQGAEKSGASDWTTAFIQVAKQNIPAVVHIEVIQRQEFSNPLFPFENDPFFRRFFQNPRTPKKYKRELKGLGSGMIIDAQGHILTNYHVIGGATTIEVQLSDGRRFAAKVVGTDPKTDLAVIRIAADGRLPFVAFGDSDKVEVGQWVIAIGHPRGLDQTVTQGIISAKHRRGITEPNSYQDFLQTDAAINPGSSGGPLLNLKGEVIGVNAAIASESGGFEGIGFTIPSNMALFVAKSLIASGKVKRSWLGVQVQDLTPAQAQSLRSGTAKGALVAEVVHGGPADKGGLKKNDVVIFFHGKETPDSSAFLNEVIQTPVGKDVKITVLREGKKLDLAIKTEGPESSQKFMEASLKDRLGAEVRPLKPQEASHYGLDENRGVAIQWLDKNSPLKKAGFEVGDIILSVERHPVEGVEGFVRLVSSLKARTRVALLALDYRTGRVGTLSIVLIR
ncbi:MAG TPA: Do family serine endopeptidase [Thermodesulfobacteriota bacterium]|nr:Do family serine endopeptidase [Thermodesulfobacteriota bacterium]